MYTNMAAFMNAQRSLREKIGMFAVKTSVVRCNMILNNQKYGNISYLKPKQYDTVLECTSRDVLAVLPTGYGKTIVLQVLPFLTERAGCIVTISPLNAILQEQQERFGSCSILVDEALLRDLKDCMDREGDLGEPEDGDHNLKVMGLLNGHYDYILGHPETITSDTMKSVFKRKQVSGRITHIVVDEAHCVLQWGASGFRESFLQIASLRSHLPCARILAMTATCTKTEQTEIIQLLGMMKGTAVVQQSPDRPNIFLEVVRRLPSTEGPHCPETSYNAIMDPIMKDLQEQGSNYKKTIIYCPLEWCGRIHSRAVNLFLSDHPQQKTVQETGAKELQCLVQQYHSPQTAEMKSLITKSMKDPDGHLRLLLATEAYGMGTDAPDVRHVRHIGPPNSIETYMQEIGRCGRDGKDGKATLYYNSSDIATNKDHLKPEMREYCETLECRRKFLLSYFGFLHVHVDCDHNCCDNCKRNCICIECRPRPNVRQISKSCTKQAAAKQVSCVQQIEKATNMLKMYFSAENSLIQCTPIPQAVTGLSTSTAESIAKNSHLYTNFNMLATDYPLLKDTYLTNILSILNTARCK